MRATRASAVLMAALLVGAVGCGTSGDDDAAPTPSTRAKAPASTTVASGGEPETTVEETPTARDSASATTACDLLEPADLTEAGLDGMVREKGDVSENFSVNSLPSTACSFIVQQGGSGASVIVLVVEDAPDDAFEDATDFVDDPEEIDEIGGRAVYEAKGMNERSNAVYAQQGNRLIKISGADSSISPKATLVALARTVLAA